MNNIKDLTDLKRLQEKINQTKESIFLCLSSISKYRFFEYKIIQNKINFLLIELDRNTLDSFELSKILETANFACLNIDSENDKFYLEYYF